MAIKDLHNDESGMLMEWLVGLFGLLFVIFAYVLFAPIGNVLIGTFVENGAPAAPLLFMRKMFMWGFAIFGVLCLMYPFISSYRKTYDQGLDGSGLR